MQVRKCLWKMQKLISDHNKHKGSTNNLEMLHIVVEGVIEWLSDYA